MNREQMNKEQLERLRQDERRLTVARQIARRVWDDRDMVAEKVWEDSSAREAIARIIYMVIREQAGLPPVKG